MLGGIHWNNVSLYRKVMTVHGAFSTSGHVSGRVHHLEDTLIITLATRIDGSLPPFHRSYQLLKKKGAARFDTPGLHASQQKPCRPASVCLVTPHPWRCKVECQSVLLNRCRHHVAIGLECLRQKWNQAPSQGARLFRDGNGTIRRKASNLASLKIVFFNVNLSLVH